MNTIVIADIIKISFSEEAKETASYFTELSKNERLSSFYMDFEIKDFHSYKYFIRHISRDWEYLKGLTIHPQARYMDKTVRYLIDQLNVAVVKVEDLIKQSTIIS